MKKKCQPRFNSRKDAVDAIEAVQNDVPKGGLSHVSRHTLDEWHGTLDAAIRGLESLGLPPEVSCVKKLRLRIKEAMENASVMETG